MYTERELDIIWEEIKEENDNNYIQFQIDLMSDRGRNDRLGQLLFEREQLQTDYND